MLVYQLLSSCCDKMPDRISFKGGKFYFGSWSQRNFSLSWLERHGRGHSGMTLEETPHVYGTEKQTNRQE